MSNPASIAPEKLTFLQHHPLFGVLEPEQIRTLREHANQKLVPRGSTIFSKGDLGGSLFAIVEGQVKVASYSALGKNAVFNVLSNGDIFGEIAFLDGGERTADVTALTDCKLLVIERRDFLSLALGNRTAAQKLIEVLCKRLRNTSRQVEEVMFFDLSARLAKALLRLATPRKAGQPPVLSLTQNEIAQIVGSTRESTNKQLREWERNKWLRLERGGLVILSPDSLTALCESAEDFD